MDFKNTQERNLENARRLVKQIQDAIGRNQRALQRNKQEHDELMSEASALTSQLAAAAEYLGDLEQAQND